MFNPLVKTTTSGQTLWHTQAFLDKFTKVAPSTLTPPSFPSEFVSEAAAAAAKKGEAKEEAPASGVPEKLTFSFYLPHATLGKGKKVGSFP